MVIRRLTKVCTLGMAGFLAAAAPAYSQHPWLRPRADRVQVPECVQPQIVNVPPLQAPKAVTPSAPVTPSSPAPTTPEAPMPSTPPAPEAPSPLTQEPTVDFNAPVSVAGLGGFASISPNLFGDQFGASRGKSFIVITQPRTVTLTKPGVLNNTRVAVSFPATDSKGSGPNFSWIYDSTATSIPVSLTFAGQPTRLLSNFTVPVIFEQPAAGAASTQAQNAVASVSRPVAAQIETAASPGYTLQSYTLSDFTFGTSGEVDLDYTALVNDTVATRVNVNVPTRIFFNLPTPGNGGVVGRVKLSEDSSPMPRDRIIFNYDYFNNTTLGPGVDVNRYTFGLEKTFFNGNTSIEVRIPLASTMNSDQFVGTQSMNTEIGNLHVLLKGLIYQTNELFVATGLGISTPTADATRVFTTSGTELVRINNNTVMLEPYIAALYVPNDRFFAQAWLTWVFNASGDRVQANLNGQGLQNLGTINAQTLMQADLQLGYWAYRSGDRSSRLRAIAPFVELHYTGTLNDADVISTSNFLIGDLTGRFDQLNLASGFMTQWGDNMTVNLGLVVPLNDRDFDYQLGLRANIFFGPTAARRSEAYRVAGF